MSTKSFTSPIFPSNQAVATFGKSKYMRVNFSNATDNFPSAYFTISFWMRPDAQGTLIFYGDAEQASLFDSILTTMEIRVNGSNIEVQFVSTSNIPAYLSAPFVGNQAHYVAFTFRQEEVNPGFVTCNLFIDDADPVTQNILLTNAQNQRMFLPLNGPLYIGCKGPDSDNHIYYNDIFKGPITDLRVWEHPMSKGEILLDSFNELNGDENNLFLALPLNADTYDPDTNTSLDLADEHPVSFIQVYDSPGFIYVGNFNAMPTELRTIEMWVRCNADANGYILSYGDFSNSHDHMNDTTNPLYWNYSGTLSINGRSTDISFHDGDWHHLAVVTTANSEIIYLDGFQKQITNNANSPLTQGQPFLLGVKNSDDTDQAFNGLIQEVYIWHTALDADAILDRALQLPPDESEMPNIAGYFPLTLDGPVDEKLQATSFGASSGLRYTSDIQPLSDGINWQRDQRISSRVSLTEDYSVAEAKLAAKPVYRISIKVSPKVSEIKISSPETIQITIDDVVTTLQPNNVLSAKPNIFSKLILSIPADDIRCPLLKLQTDLMPPDQYHYLFPDIEVHKKIVNLQPGQMASQDARSAMGIAATVTDDDLNNIQTAIQNISKSVQHTYNRLPHSIHRDRAILPVNMQHPHFKVEFTDNKPVYTPLSPDDVPALANAPGTIVKNTAGQEGFFDIAKNYLLNASKIVVHTIQSVGGEIIRSAENIGSDLAKTVDRVGEDIIHGDIIYAGQDLMKGGENLQKDLVVDAAGIVLSAVVGAGQLIVLTIHTEIEIVQYVLSHTGDVGRVISAFLQKVGIEITKAVNWLMDKLKWDEILITQKFILQTATAGFDKFITFINDLQSQGDAIFTNFSTNFQADIESFINTIKPLPKLAQPSPPLSHSSAIEKTDWLLNKISKNVSSSSAFTIPLMTEAQNTIADQLLGIITTNFGDHGTKLADQLQTAKVDDFNSLFTAVSNTAEYLINAFLEIVKVSVTFCLNILKQVFDLMMQLMVSMINNVKSQLLAEWTIPVLGELYSTITGGETLNILGFSCMLVAIPTNMIIKSELGFIPFKPETTNTERLATPIPQNILSYASTYGAMQILLTPVSIIMDIKSLIVNFNTETADIFKGIGTNIQQKDPKSIDVIFGLMNLSFGFVSQFMANPIPPDQHYALPDPATKNNVLEAPNYWSHAIWVYQWFGIGPNIIGNLVLFGSFKAPLRTKVLGSIMACYNTAFGITHMALMARLDYADRQKINALLVRVENHENVSDWPADLQNYYKWATDDGRITLHSENLGGLDFPDQNPLYRKTFGNIMDTIPEIGQIGSLPPLVKYTLGLSMIGTLLFDTLGHLGEGITVIVRTENNELY